MAAKDPTKQTGHFRGAGGTVWQMDLPLPELYGQQLAKGDLVRVTADGQPWTGGPTPVLGNPDIPVDPRDAEIARLRAENEALRAAESDQPPAGGSPLTGGQVRKPPASGSKADWVAYAVAQGMTVADAETATRDELAKRYADN
jgi:hypothetical protein